MTTIKFTPEGQRIVGSNEMVMDGLIAVFHCIADPAANWEEAAYFLNNNPTPNQGELILEAANIIGVTNNDLSINAAKGLETSVISLLKQGFSRNVSVPPPTSGITIADIDKPLFTIEP